MRKVFAVHKENWLVTDQNEVEMKSLGFLPGFWADTVPFTKAVNTWREAGLEGEFYLSNYGYVENEYEVEVSKPAHTQL